jgi:hypothetical protein
MFPKEHGVYGQLIFPLVTSLLVAGVTAPALLTALAAGAAFMSHEPALVLLGRRGARAARETGQQALVWWSVSIAAAVLAAGLALWLAPHAERWAFAYPVLPAVVLATMFATNREKGSIGELAVAAACSSLAIPICRLAGATAAVSFAVALAFLAVFLTSTLAVRVVILKVRGGGNIAAVRATQGAFFVVVGAMLIGLTMAAVRGALPWAPLLAVVPSWLVTTSVAVHPPPPTCLKQIGWTLMATSLAATLILVVTL